MAASSRQMSRKAKDEGVPQKAAATQASRHRLPATAAHPAASGPSDDMVRKLFAEGSYEELPHDGMRKTIASRLSESNATVPSYNISVDCQLDALLKLRGELNKAAPEKDGKPAYKLSVNDFIIKALALALRDVPMANASWTSSARSAAQAFGRGRGCGHSGRSDHANRPARRGKGAVCHFG
jgi:pyruvate dehydrogenase E2 component (dihydrolipoamide acetyltransferase)